MQSSFYHIIKMQKPLYILSSPHVLTIISLLSFIKLFHIFFVGVFWTFNGQVSCREKGSWETEKGNNMQQRTIGAARSLAYTYSVPIPTEQRPSLFTFKVTMDTFYDHLVHVT